MKRILSFLLALIMCVAIPVSAETFDVTYERYWCVDGEVGYFPDNIVVKYGTEITILVDDIVIDNESVDVKDLTFEWYDGQSKLDSTSNELTVTVNATATYNCHIYKDKRAISGTSFNVVADTLTVTASAGDLRIEADEDLPDTFFYVYDCVKGNEIELSVSATSVVSDAEINYTWYNYDEYRMPDQVMSKENTLKVTKGQGFEYYVCMVSDGIYTKYVDYRLDPINTMDEIVTINGIKPKRFERGYMAVAKAGETVEMKVETTSTYGDVTYRWEKTEYGFDENDEWYHRVIDMGTSNTLTITKAELETIDATETFECYVEDGNELIDVGFILFSLDPSQIIAGYEISEETPNVTICANAEEIANRLLQENMEDLQMTKTATVTLTAETQETLTDAEQAIVEEELAEGSEIGISLDLNLYKKIDGEERQEITETAKEITLSVELPEELINTDESVTRSYEVIRIHDGEAETLACDYDAEAGTISFETDRFSCYTVVYSDESNIHDYAWNAEQNQYLCECGEAYTWSNDLDGDRKGTIADAIVLLRTVDGLDTGLPIWAADVSGNGKVNVFDAVRYLQILVE